MSKRKYFILLVVFGGIFILLSIPQLHILEKFTRNELITSSLRFVFTILSGAVLTYLIAFDKLFNEIYKITSRYKKELFQDFWKNFLEQKLEQKFKEMKEELLQKTFTDYIRAFAPEIGDNAVKEIKEMFNRLGGIIRENYRRIDEIQYVKSEKGSYTDIRTIVEYFLKNQSDESICYISPQRDIRCYLLFYDEVYEKEKGEKALYDEIKKGTKYFYAWKVMDMQTLLESLDISIIVENLIVNETHIPSKEFRIHKGIEIIEQSPHYLLLKFSQEIKIFSHDSIRLRFDISRRMPKQLRNYYFYTRELMRNATIRLKILNENRYTITPYLYLWSVKKPFIHTGNYNELVIDIDDVILPYGAIHFYIFPDKNF